MNEDSLLFNISIEAARLKALAKHLELYGKNPILRVSPNEVLIQSITPTIGLKYRFKIPCVEFTCRFTPSDPQVMSWSFDTADLKLICAQTDKNSYIIICVSREATSTLMFSPNSALDQLNQARLHQIRAVPSYDIQDRVFEYSRFNRDVDRPNFFLTNTAIASIFNMPNSKSGQLSMRIFRKGMKIIPSSYAAKQVEFHSTLSFGSTDEEDYDLLKLQETTGEEYVVYNSDHQVIQYQGPFLDSSGKPIEMGHTGDIFDGEGHQIFIGKIQTSSSVGPWLKEVVLNASLAQLLMKLKDISHKESKLRFYHEIGRPLLIVGDASFCASFEIYYIPSTGHS